MTETMTANNANYEQTVNIGTENENTSEAYSNLSYQHLMNSFNGNVSKTALAPVSQRYIDNLTAEQLKEIEDIKSTIDLYDRDVRTYGKEAQAEMSSYASSILASSITSQMGEAGEALATAMQAIKNNGVIEEKSSNPLVRLFGKLKKHSDEIEIKGRTLQENIANLEKELLHQADQLDSLSEEYRNMYDDNMSANANLNKFILAGEEKLEEELATYAKLKADVEAHGSDIIELEHLADYEARINEFARRLDEIKCTKYLTVVQVPETRFIVYNARELASKLRSIAVNVGPFLSTQFAIAVGNQKLSEAVSKIEQVNTGINTIMVENAKSISTLTPAIIKSIEAPIINEKTIDEVGKHLIDSLEKSIKIADDAKKARLECAQKREEAEERIRLAIESNQGTLAYLTESKQNRSSN